MIHLRIAGIFLAIFLILLAMLLLTSNKDFMFWIYALIPVVLVVQSYFILKTRKKDKEEKTFEDDWYDHK